MANFKFVISQGKYSAQVEKDQKDCPVAGMRIGDVFPGDFLGLNGYELKISGGSDKDGFPMKSDIEGVLRKKFIMTSGLGFDTNVKGLRRRRMLRGNTIGTDIVQINCSVQKAGEKKLEEIIPPKPKKEEKKE